MSPVSRLLIASLALGTAVSGSVVAADSLNAVPASSDRLHASEAAVHTAALRASWSRAAMLQEQARQKRVASSRLAGTAAKADATRVAAAKAAAGRANAANAAKAAAAQAAQAAKAAQRSSVAKPASVTAPARKAAAVAPAETYLQRGNRVLASLNYNWQSLGYRIEFLPPKQGYLGMTIGAEKKVQIYVSSRHSDMVLAHTIAHEIGHVLDFTRGTDSTRNQYRKIRGLSTSQPWYGCSGCSDYRTAAGDWAEVFAYWLAGPGDFRSQMAGAPSSSQLAQFAPMFRN